jgi:hypothetical protein
MFENNGTTPEGQGFTIKAVHDAIDSALDKVEAVANEALQDRITELEDKLAKVEASRDQWVSFFNSKNDTIMTARTHIENAIENGDISENELTETFWTELFEILGVESHEIVEIDVVATWTVSVSKPRGRALDASDFTAELQIESSDIDFDGWARTPEMDISEN